MKNLKALYMKPLTYAAVFLLLLTAGCAAQKTSSASNHIETISEKPFETYTEDEDFDLLEEELSEQMVKVSDPLEPFNRVMFNVNDTLYFWVVKPVTKTYRGAVPKPGRIGIRNFFQNLITPVRLVNCLLQGKGQAAEREVKRFAINTTVGVLGVGDPALDKYGLEPANEDLGQTLAVYGLKDGFYIVWPLLGPSTLRDSGGMVGDYFLNPVRYVEPAELAIGASAVNVVNKGSFRIGEYEDFKAAAVDPYVAMRRAYIQYRTKQIKE